MMNAMLMALVGLLEMAVKYSIAAVFVTLLLFAIVFAGRWLLYNSHPRGMLSQSGA